MLQPGTALDQLDAHDERTVVHARSWHEALDVMLALWEEARALNPDLGADWRADLEADVAVARTLNARP